MKMRNLTVLVAALCLFAACKNSDSYEAKNADVAATIDSVASDPQAQKLVITAEMKLKVKNAVRVSEQIVDLTTAYHGKVNNHHLTSEEVRAEEMPLSNDSLQRVTVFHTTADITVQIPSDSLERFMNTVGKMGIYVSTRRMDIEDKTLEQLSAQLKLNNRIETADEQLTAQHAKRKVEYGSKVLALKDQIVDENINSKRIEMAAKMSTLDISLDQSQAVVIEHIANDDPGAYQIPLMQRLAFAFTNGWSIFMAFMISIANLWVFIIIGLASWWTFNRYYKRKPLPVAPNA